MKRIIAVILVLILILSCCPSVSAADGGAEGGYLFSDMNPQIKEFIDSQISEEEKNKLIALDPALSDKLILKAIMAMPWPLSEKSPREMIAMCLERDTARNFQFYFVFSNSVQYIEFREDNGKQSIWDMYPDHDFANDTYITDILNLGAQIEIDGKLSTITDLYLFGQYSVTICILTEDGALFKYYKDGKSEPLILTEKEFQKYGPAYYYYMTSLGRDEYGHGITGYTPPLDEFIDKYDQYMAEADEMNAKRRAVQTKQALKTYGLIAGSIALGVVLVAGVAAVGVVIYRRRRKAVLPIEVVADPVDDP